MKALSVFLTFGLLLGAHELAAQLRRSGALPAVQISEQRVHTTQPVYATFHTLQNSSTNHVQ